MHDHTSTQKRCFFASVNKRKVKENGISVSVVSGRLHSSCSRRFHFYHVLGKITAQDSLSLLHTLAVTPVAADGALFNRKTLKNTHAFQVCSIGIRKGHRQFVSANLKASVQIQNRAGLRKRAIISTFRRATQVSSNVTKKVRCGFLQYCPPSCLSFNQVQRDWLHI